MVSKSKVMAKVVHLYAGLELIGSKSSVSHREAEIEVTPMGLRIVSKKTKRLILIPWANVKGCELFPQPDEEELSLYDNGEDRRANATGKAEKRA